MNPYNTQYFKAVKVTAKEIHANPTSLTFIENDQRYILRPIQIVSEVSDEEIDAMFPLNPDGYDELGTLKYKGKRDGAKWMRSKLAPTIAVLKARVEELEKGESFDADSMCIQLSERIKDLELQLDQEKEKSRERIKNFAYPYLNSYGYSEGEIEQKIANYLTSLTDQSGK